MFRKIIFLILTITGFSYIYAQSLTNDNIKDGYTKYMIMLPRLVDEHNYKVELLIGKKMFIDGCNEYRFEGEIEDRGTYLYVDNIGMMKAITQLECQDKKRDRFVSIFRSEELWRDYNSQSAIIVYLPKWYEVRYKVWKSHSEIKRALNKK